MIASLARFIDWLFIQQGFRRLPPINEQTLRLEEAIQFATGANFIPAESLAAAVEFDPADGALHFRFPTPRPSAFAENNTVHGRLSRCGGGRWQERPTVILLHGGNLMRGGRDAIGYWFRQPLAARECNRAGLNAATLELPYHFRRHPRQGLNNLNYLRLMEAAGQAVAEIRALNGWLLDAGCPAVGLWGTSMGARLAGMTVCREPRLAAVVMTVPGVRSDRAFAEQIAWPRVRDAVRRLCVSDEKLNATPLNLTLGRPAIPKENILLISAIHDLFTPSKAIEELCEVWGRPGLWRLPHGHVSKSLVPGLIPRVLGWLAPRNTLLKTPRKTGRGNSVHKFSPVPYG